MYMSSVYIMCQEVVEVVGPAHPLVPVAIITDLLVDMVDLPDIQVR